MILSLVLLMASMALLAVLFAKWTTALMGRFGGEAIHRLHADAESILETKRAPVELTRRIERRFPSPAGGGAAAGDAAAGGAAGKDAGGEARERDRKRAEAACLARLSALERHFARTSLVADEATRELLLAELAEVRRLWVEAGWEAMRAPAASESG